MFSLILLCKSVCRLVCKARSAVLYALFLAAVVWVLGSSSVATAAVFRNEITDRHVSIGSVGLAFIPAPGLTPSKRFDGFESAERGIEVVVAAVRAPYAEIVAGFDEANMKSRGLDMKSKTPVRINGADACLIKALHATEGADWGKWILLMDGGDVTFVVNGAFLSGDNAASGDTERMLKSVVAQKRTPGRRAAEEKQPAKSVSGDKRPVSADAGRPAATVSEDAEPKEFSAYEINKLLKDMLKEREQKNRSDDVRAVSPDAEPSN